MTVRCGNHGRGAHVYHTNPAEVRACYANRLEHDHNLDPPGERLHRPNTFGPDHEPEPTHALNAQARTRNPEVQITKLRLDRVWEGGYAIEDPTDGKLRFLEVNRPDDGQWSGWTFVRVRAGDELHKLGSVNPRYGTYRGKAPALVGALAALDEEGLKQSTVRFGLEIGECGFCRRSLTDEDSRDLGYGPICAGRHGLYHPRARTS